MTSVGSGGGSVGLQLSTTKKGGGGGGGKSRLVDIGVSSILSTDQACFFYPD
jgi:hypothetical protein